MKKTLALMAIVLTVGMTAALDAEARRLGGGKSAGMQRQNTTAPPAKNPPAAPGNPAQTAPAAGSTAAAAAPAAAGAAAKRSWMGPVAGIAAGLGIAALASHLGFGEALANILTIALLGMVVLVVIGFVMRRRMAAQGGLAGTGGASAVGGMAREQAPQQAAWRTPVSSGGSMIGSRIGGGLTSAAAAGGAVGQIPAGFDTAGFERTARDQFLALQAANDARDLDRLRDYLTPEMFEAVRAEIAERGDAPQKTEAFGLQAQVLNVAEEADQYVVSVRFTGSIREQFGAETEDLDEVWHLTKPKSGFGGWLIAGIQQAQ
jgi:predicted lipid-binding transport protein (Tim44 family)